MQGELQEITKDADGWLRSVLDYRLLQLAGQEVYVHSVLVFLLILLATFVGSQLIQRAMVRVLRRAGVEEAGSVAVFRRLIHYIVVAVGLTTGLATLGFDLAALFAAGAIFAIAIGFAMQNIAQNFVSGVILLVERSIKPFDILDLNGKMVRVVSMGIRSTIVRTLNDEDLIVPNADLVQSVVSNYTLRDSFYRLRMTVGVAYESDLRVVDAVLREAAETLPWRDREHGPRILLSSFGSSSVDFEVSVWIANPWELARRRSDLHHAVWWALKEAGVTIAFPQVDVHLDEPTRQLLAASASRRGQEGEHG